MYCETQHKTVLRSAHTAVFMFCVDLTTNSDYFPIQHYLTGLYNRDGQCLLRGTISVFKYRYHSG